MSDEKFEQYLRNLYWPHIEPPGDELGGYWVPNRLPEDRPGLLPRFYRWLGRLLRMPTLYKRGVQFYNPIERIVKAHAERQVRAHDRS